MARNQSFADKFWHDKHGNFVAWQKPNVFLWVWIASVVIDFFGSSTFTRYAGYVGGVSIIIWAILELVLGASYFRRLLGLCVLLLFGVSHL